MAKSKSSVHQAASKGAKIGRPAKYNSPEAMQAQIDDYFASCDAEQRPYSIPGLAYHLGFSSRGSLYDYEHRNANNAAFSDTIKKARLRIEVQRAEMLVTCKGNPAGIIFDLKANFGWKDQQSIEVTGPEDGPLQLTSGLAGMPPRPKSMEEWTRWYNQVLNAEGNGEVLPAAESVDGP